MCAGFGVDDSEASVDQEDGVVGVGVGAVCVGSAGFESEDGFVKFVGMGLVVGAPGDAAHGVWVLDE